MRQDDFERGMEKEQIVMQGMETVLRMLETLVKAKKYSDHHMEGFRTLLKYARQGGEIRCDVIEPEEFEIFRELLEEHAVAYGATIFKDAEGEEHVTVMYKDEDEGRMRVVRTEFMQKKVEHFVEPEEIRQEDVKAQRLEHLQEGNRSLVQGQAQGGARERKQDQARDGGQDREQERVPGEVRKREAVQGQGVDASRNWAPSAEREKEREKQESISR